MSGHGNGAVHAPKGRRAGLVAWRSSDAIALRDSGGNDTLHFGN
jgi:hypothetical protein